MGKEIKIGLAIVGVLLASFGGVVAYRVYGSNEKASEVAEVRSEKEALAAFREKSSLLENLKANPVEAAERREQRAESPPDQVADPFAARPHHHHGAPASEAATAEMLNNSAGDRYSNRAAPLGDPQEGAPRYGGPVVGPAEAGMPPMAGAPADMVPFNTAPFNTAPDSGQPTAMAGDSPDPFKHHHHHPPAAGLANDPGPAPPFVAGQDTGPLRANGDGRWQTNPDMAGPSSVQATDPAGLQPVAAMGPDGNQQGPLPSARYGEYREPQRHHEHHHGMPPQATPLDNTTPAQFVGTEYQPGGARGAEPAAPMNSGAPQQYDIYGRDVANNREPVDPPADPVPAQPPQRPDYGQLPIEPRERRERLEGEFRGGGSETYVVIPNDNYWSISEKIYGSGAYFKALEEHNREQHPYADRLRVGDVVAVPSIKTLEKHYPDMCPKQRSAPVGAQPSTMSVSLRERGQGRIYKVQQGDTLFDIARYELGKASRWAEIYELNRAQLGDDFDFLAPGMELVLPDNRTAKDPEPLTTQSRQPYNR